MATREFTSVPPLSETALRVIGRGLSFPFSFASTGRAHQPLIAQGIDKINESIHMILSTRPGERLMLPEYGSRLPYLVFEPDDDILHVLLQVNTADALRRWEKRITIVGITTIDEPDLNTISIEISYIINSTHTPGSYVFPFVKGALPLNQTVQRTIAG